MNIKTKPQRPISAALMVTVLVAACGGGGTQEAATADTISSSTATDAASDTVVIANESMTAIDVVVVSAEEAIEVQSASASSESPLSYAPTSEKPNAAVSVPVSCPGGGSATIKITGGTPASVLNGKPDAGEEYAIHFTQCQAATGTPSVNGSLSMAVVGINGTSAQLALNLADVSVKLSRGTVGLSGSINWQGSSTTTEGSTSVNSALQVASLGMTTSFGERTGSFELRHVDVTRASQWTLGAPVSGSVNGSYTIASSRPNNSFEATVVTSGSTQYGADGTPSSGHWGIAFPTWSMDMDVSSQAVTLSIDQGKDGKAEKTYTTTPSALSADAG